jgi:hypothetical protein
MSSYEQALNVARTTPVIVPEFEAIASASDEERKRHADEDRDARTKARRWFLFAAAAWLLLPLLLRFWSDHFVRYNTGSVILHMYLGMVLPMLSMLLWAAHVSRERGTRANIFIRAIAASNLVLALLCSGDPSKTYCVFAILLTVASSRSLQLLGERGLDASEGHDSHFEPIRFRGVLILTLVLACADAVTLLWSTTISLASYFIADPDGYVPHPLRFGLTAAATAIMAVNAWGLLRLRTWALFSSMLANVGIAALALSGVLLVGSWVSITLVTTAGIQLLLPLPILAAALGIGGARRYAWVGPLLLRVVVPAAVLITIVMAMLHLRWSMLAAWYSAWY